jgi:hypothetical protein
MWIFCTEFADLARNTVQPKDLTVCGASKAVPNVS